MPEAAAHKHTKKEGQNRGEDGGNSTRLAVHAHVVLDCRKQPANGLGVSREDREARLVEICRLEDGRLAHMLEVIMFYNIILYIFYTIFIKKTSRACWPSAHRAPRSKRASLAHAAKSSA